MVARVNPAGNDPIQGNAGTQPRVEKKKIDLDELIQAALKAKPQEKDLTTKEKLDLVMAEFDTNKDGDISSGEADAGLKRLGEAEAKAETEATETPEVDKKEPTAYTVQNGEGFKSLIKRSLQAQGIENPTKEQMDEAIKEFKENPKNKGAFRTNSKGVTYLLVGKKVYIAGGLEDKNNSDEQIMAYTKAMSAKRQIQTPEKTTAGDKTGSGAKAQDAANTSVQKGYQPVEGAKSRYHANEGFKIDKINDDGTFFEKSDKDPNITLLCNKNGSVLKRFEKKKDGSFITSTYKQGNLASREVRTKDGKRMKTHYDSKGKHAYTEKYDADRHLTFRRNHKLGCTETYTGAFINYNVKILTRKYDDGHIEYLKQDKQGNYTVRCDAQGNEIK